MIFVPFVEPRRNPFFIYFGRAVRRLVLVGLHEMVNRRKPHKTKIRYFSLTTEVLQTDIHSVKVHASGEVPCVNNDLLMRCVTVVFKFRG